MPPWFFTRNTSRGATIIVERGPNSGSPPFRPDLWLCFRNHARLASRHPSSPGPRSRQTVRNAAYRAPALPTNSGRNARTRRQRDSALGFTQGTTSRTEGHSGERGQTHSQKTKTNRFSASPFKHAPAPPTAGAHPWWGRAHESDTTRALATGLSPHVRGTRQHNTRRSDHAAADGGIYSPPFSFDESLI